jgi:hypothetical protein
MIRVVHPGSEFFTHPGSRSQKGTGSRISNLPWVGRDFIASTSCYYEIENMCCLGEENPADCQQGFSPRRFCKKLTISKKKILYKNQDSNCVSKYLIRNS